MAVPDPTRTDGTARTPEEQHTVLSGRVLAARYEVLSEVGRGAMGRVLRAHDSKLGRDVAVKLLAPGASEEHRLRFEQEARAAGALNHPNILAVHDVGEHEGEPFIVTELLEGETLRSLLSRGPLAPHAALELATQLAQGLAAAHAAGIVHRDIKPDNLFVTAQGHLKILDFGIAKLRERSGPPAVRTETGVGIGTPGYMSPEQVEGRQATARSDVFAFGAVLHEMLAGHGPVDRRTAVESAYAVLRDPPDALPSSTPAPVGRLVARCLQKEEAARPADGGEIVAELRKLPTQPLRRRRTIGVAAATLAVIAIAAAAVLRPRTEPGPPSVAVLPFANLSGDKDQEYLSDGITEELIDALANIEGIHVASRTSVFALKGKNLEAPEIGARLGVRTLVEGSVRREGNELRVTAQLVDVGRDVHLWSKTYTREVKSIFALEQEIAHSITQSLRPRLLGATSRVRDSTDNSEAHDLYLRGRYIKEKRTPETLRAAASYFEQAVGKDPRYALAWVGLAEATVLLVDSGEVAASAVLPKALAAVQRALDLDPDLPEAHGIRALISIYQYDWVGAEREIRRAIEAKPDDASAHHRYALILAWTGRLKEADPEGARALALDPASLIINHLIGVLRYYERDFDAALAAFDKTLELEPRFAHTHAVKGWTYAAQGKYAQAESEYDKGTPSWVELGRGYTYGISGQRDAALKILAQMEARARTGYSSPAMRGYIYLSLGMKDRGFELLREGCAQNDRNLSYAKVEPMFDGFRRDRRFHDVLKCANLE